MTAQVILIGDPQVQADNWRQGLERRWIEQKAGFLQRKLDLKWHRGFINSKQEFVHVLDSVRKHMVNPCERVYLNGDLINPESFSGLSDPKNVAASEELASWLQREFPEVWARMDARTGNHDIGFSHPCAKWVDCRVTPRAFEQFERIWGTPAFTQTVVGNVTFIGLSSDLLLLDGVELSECMQLTMEEFNQLQQLRREHYQQLYDALERASHAVLVFHSPEAFRMLRSSGDLYWTTAGGSTVQALWAKVRACFVSHLEHPGTLEHYCRFYQTVKKVVQTPLAHLARVLFRSPDAVAITRNHVYGCAQASKYLHPTTILVPKPKFGYVECHIDGNSILVQYRNARGSHIGSVNV